MVGQRSPDSQVCTCSRCCKCCRSQRPQQTGIIGCLCLYKQMNHCRGNGSTQNTVETPLKLGSQHALHLCKHFCLHKIICRTILPCINLQHLMSRKSSCDFRQGNARIDWGVFRSIRKQKYRDIDSGFLQLRPCAVFIDQPNLLWQLVSLDLTRGKRFSQLPVSGYRGIFNHSINTGQRLYSALNIAVVLRGAQKVQSVEVSHKGVNKVFIDAPLRRVPIFLKQYILSFSRLHGGRHGVSFCCFLTCLFQYYLLRFNLFGIVVDSSSRSVIGTIELHSGKIRFGYRQKTQCLVSVNQNGLIKVTIVASNRFVEENCAGLSQRSLCDILLIKLPEDFLSLIIGTYRKLVVTMKTDSLGQMQQFQQIHAFQIFSGQRINHRSILPIGSGKVVSPSPGFRKLGHLLSMLAGRTAPEQNQSNKSNNEFTAVSD